MLFLGALLLPLAIAICNVIGIDLHKPF
jgi:hypothetical protein